MSDRRQKLAKLHSEAVRLKWAFERSGDGDIVDELTQAIAHLRVAMTYSASETP